MTALRTCAACAAVGTAMGVRRASALLLLAVLLAVLVVLAPASAPPPPPPRDPENRRPVDPTAFIEEQIAAGNIPGCSVAVTVGDEVAWHGAFGSAFPEDGASEFATTDDTAFTFASISKTITGVAVLMLHERGLVDLDADINTYLPWSVAVDGISLNMLMTHTSSITEDYYFTMPEHELYRDGDPILGLEEFNTAMFTEGGRWFSERTFRGAPGDRYDYTNVGSSLAAEVVEAVALAAGLAPDYNTFVQDLIFAPLGAEQGSHYLRDFPRDMEPPLGARPSEFWRGEYESWAHYSVPDYPNGFWRSNSLTYAALLGAVANGGVWQGARVLTGESVEIIKQRSGWDGGRQGRAFWYYTSANSRVIGHEGAELGVATMSYLDLETGVGATVLTNGDFGQGGGFEQAVERIVNHCLEVFAGERKRKQETVAVGESREVARYLNRTRHHSAAAVAEL
jgi:CubicO group peptidase (beta-lactamase class C family)